jgi:hypothetical protein
MFPSKKSNHSLLSLPGMPVTTVLVVLSMVLLVVKMFALAQQESGMPGAATNLDQKNIESVDDLLSKKRIREGTILKGSQGYFRVTGSRVTLFTSDESRRFVCLENLNLERVLQVIRDNPTQLEWSVDGEITEYQGENFLLIHRVLLSAPSKDSYR